MKELGRRLAAKVTRFALVRRVARASAKRGLIPSAVWRRLPPGVTQIDVELPWGRFRYVVDPEDPFTRQLAWRGLRGPEGASLLAFGDLARSAQTVVDVGAHTGLYTLTALASSPGLRCISFEPVERNRTLLAENLRLNNLEERCEVRPEAVCDVSGEVDFHIPKAHHPMSASLNPGGFRGLAGELRRVPAVTLDAALSGRVVDLVKIDVEGFEDRVLEGMTRQLANRPILVVECNPDGPYRRVSKLLGSHGYRFRSLDGRSSALLEAIHPDHSEMFRNVLCVPG